MELRKNRIKQRLAAGQVATVVSGITHPDDIDAFGPVAAATGVDGIWLEGEHGQVDAAELGNLTRLRPVGVTSVESKSPSSAKTWHSGWPSSR